MFFLFAVDHNQFSFGTEQDNGIINPDNIPSLVNASIAKATYYTITNATTPVCSNGR